MDFMDILCLLYMIFFLKPRIQRSSINMLRCMPHIWLRTMTVAKLLIFTSNMEHLLMLRYVIDDLLHEKCSQNISILNTFTNCLTIWYMHLILTKLHINVMCKTLIYQKSYDVMIGASTGMMLSRWEILNITPSKLASNIKKQYIKHV